MTFCSKCGKPLGDKDEFCPACGEKTQGVQAAKKPQKSIVTRLFGSVFNLIVDVAIGLLIILIFIYYVLPWLSAQGMLPDFLKAAYVPNH